MDLSNVVEGVERVVPAAVVVLNKGGSRLGDFRREISAWEKDEGLKGLEIAATYCIPLQEGCRFYVTSTTVQRAAL